MSKQIQCHCVLLISFHVINCHIKQNYCQLLNTLLFIYTYLNWTNKITTKGNFFSQGTELTYMWMSNSITIAYQYIHSMHCDVKTSIHQTNCFVPENTIGLFPTLLHVKSLFQLTKPLCNNWNTSKHKCKYFFVVIIIKLVAVNISCIPGMSSCNIIKKSILQLKCTCN